MPVEFAPQLPASAIVPVPILSIDLPRHEKAPLHKAATHWLRHTFGTRLICARCCAVIEGTPCP